jgi:hypothetical protein
MDSRGFQLPEVVIKSNSLTCTAGIWQDHDCAVLTYHGCAIATCHTSPNQKFNFHMLNGKFTGNIKFPVFIYQ